MNRNKKQDRFPNLINSKSAWTEEVGFPWGCGLCAAEVRHTEASQWLLAALDMQLPREHCPAYSLTLLLGPVEIIKWQSGLRPRTLELSQLVACCSCHESLPSALMLTCPQLFTTTWTPAPGAPMPSSGLHRHHTHKHTHIYIVKKINLRKNVQIFPSFHFLPRE